MSFSSRLTRIERQAALLKKQPPTCPTCRSPVPSIPPSLVLDDEGVMFNREPCRTCGCAGGGPSAIPFDPELGPCGTYKPLVVMAGITFEDWVKKHEGRRFGTHIDPWIDWMRRQQREDSAPEGRSTRIGGLRRGGGW